MHQFLSNISQGRTIYCLLIARLRMFKAESCAHFLWSRRNTCLHACLLHLHYLGIFTSLMGTEKWVLGFIISNKQVVSQIHLF